MTTYEDPRDILADHCENNHTDRPDPDCVNCDQRRELTHCGQCDASFEGGRWFTAPGSTTPNGCDHEALVDDWGNEIRCTDLTYKHSVGAWLPCGADVYRAGARQCDDHLIAVEYQRLVAVR